MGVLRLAMAIALGVLAEGLLLGLGQSSFTLLLGALAVLSIPPLAVAVWRRQKSGLRH